MIDWVAWVPAGALAVASRPPCSKMPGGEGVLFLAVGAYALFALLVFVVAAASATYRSRRQPGRERRTWLAHLTAALLLTAGPPLYLYGQGAVMTRMSQADFAREQAAFEAWQAELKLAPGHVAETLDNAFAALPRPLRWNDGQWIATLRRGVFDAFERAPATDWQPADLDAFAAFPVRLERAANRPSARPRFDSIAPLVAWARDRTDLAAATALCERSDAQTRDRCREALRFTVRGWCAAHRERCADLARDASFQRTAEAIGVYDDGRR